MFTQIYLDCDKSFEKLSSSTEFEIVANGRQGAIIGDVKDGQFPLVRTTTKYKNPAQKFKDIHYEIIEKIKKELKKENKIKDLNLNNALVEIYDSNYRKMKYHCDQAMDLTKYSYICIFSCYNDPTDLINLRTLKIKNKTTEEEQEIKMYHNSVIIFSTDTNSHNLHKIVLKEATKNNKWLGVTFRLSKSNIYFKDDKAFFTKTNEQLRVSDDEETKEFYKLRRMENKAIEFNYPELCYTISQSDTYSIN